MTSVSNVKTTKSLQIALALNYLLMGILLIAVAGFISFLNIYGAFLALVTALICAGCFKRNRWAYFAAAAWGLACYQLAKQGYEFESVKRYVMILGISVIPLALFLHEMLAKPAKKSAQNSGNNDSDKKNMPD
jgi:hypothetical protein